MSYALKKSNLGAKVLEDYTCKHCQNKGTTRITAFGKYFMAGFLPMIPLGKEAYSECASCKKTNRIEEFDEGLRAAYEASGFNTPWWHWLGCAVFVILILSMFIPILFSL